MMRAYEIPAKKEVDRSVVQAAIDKAVEAGSFTIEITDGEKSTAVQFKRFLHPIELSVYLRQVAEKALIPDSDNGCLMIDNCGLALTTHTFIFSWLSTMPDFIKREADGTVGDAVSIGSYGSYFLTISPEYQEMFDSLIDQAVAHCQIKIDNHNRMVEATYKNMDMSSFATNPEVLEIFKSLLIHPKEKDATTDSSNKITSLPLSEASE